jgi:hypothetical protein
MSVLLELLDAELQRRAENHVLRRWSWWCVGEAFCAACSPSGESAPEARLEAFKKHEANQLVKMLFRLLDEGFLTQDDLRDHSDD